MPYVAHDCRRPECRRRFLADDGGRYWINTPPKTKYCPECEDLGYSNDSPTERGRRGAEALAAYRKRKMGAEQQGKIEG